MVDRIELKIFVHKNWSLETEVLIKRAEKHFGQPCREQVLDCISAKLVVV